MQAQQKLVLTPISKSESSQEYINNLSIGGVGNNKRVDFSGGLGLGVTWKKISLNVDYYQTIGSTVNEPENNNGSFVRWNMLNIALGYMFGNSLNSK